ncbi:MULTISPECIES: hypothetical protein [Thermoanaerobacterium]|uniref:CopG family transcriptional regulator n=3 Tax=Thermoanaerobacterium TaxID=28895 RepID=L0IR28_THETR|nr:MULTISPECIES: hypothetical protein [Thermoanaerobacterium]AFK94257.1 hypothetical protein Tsac_2710 [Thermoanaerobacterium saccharolyticum JW/SL-YS485]AGB20432.1 hypothetical protein Thethe_02885 [Thermoanaerobacterium thermosaccharolyticum M0795]ETO39169.1 hypothetical protein V518_0757 [Thermoanaerobacterium aotearoense SCUT27]
MKNDKNITLRMPEKLWEEFKNTCDKNGAVPSRVIRILIQKYIDKNKKEADNNEEDS